MSAHSSGPPAIFLFFFFAIFAVVIGTILINVIKGVSDWSYNNSQPVQTDEAEVVSKRPEVSGGKQASTTYYATFELAGGQRKELKLSGDEYGQLAEGDHGELTHQGTRFLGFTRQPNKSEAPPVAPPAPPPNLVCNYCGCAIPQGTIKCASCGWTWRPTPAAAEST